MATNGALTAKQERAIIALLSESTIGAAAAAAGVGERTLFRWLTETAFQEAYYQARREAFDRAAGRLQVIATKAVDALEAVVTDNQAPPAARVSAAKAVLELGQEATIHEIERQLQGAFEQLHALASLVDKEDSSREPHFQRRS